MQPARPILLAVGLLVALTAGCGGGEPTAAETTTFVADEVAALERQQAAERARQRALRDDLARARADDDAMVAQGRRRAEDRSGAGADRRGASVSDGAGLLSAADRASFAALERSLGGSSGVVVSRAGRGRPQDAVGTLRTGVAWSTIKVPIAVAVRRAGRDFAPASAAITASDNAAAERLWASLGPPASAGRRVEATLRAAGDRATQVQTQRVRAGFTAFGQTRWSLAAQARFTAGLPCIDGGAEVLGLMGEVVAGQRWGLGSTGPTARFKGGWGPGTQGGYLVRQLGLLELSPSRPLAVAVATQQGSFERGTAALTRIARWVERTVDADRVRPPAC